jgi:DNA-binding SARP family transcriptional activator
MATRVHLCGRLALSGDAGVVDERGLPGRQGRLALALLGVERRRPVSVDRLVDVLWADAVPPDAPAALASIVSKLRTAFRRAGGDGPSVISAGAGTYQLRLAPGGTIDLEDSREAVDRAEGARRAGDERAAWSFATVAVAIGRRGFLPGESADWILAVQRELQGITRRGYACLAWVWTVRGDGELAAAMGEAALEAEPLHEPSWRNLMTIYSRFGSRADALRTFDRCRAVLRDQLDVAPDAQTIRLYDEMLAT